MKSYSICSLVLFQIVSVHGALQLNFGICAVEKKGYVGRRTEDLFSFSEEFHEVANAATLRRGLRHNFIWTDVNRFVFSEDMHEGIAVLAAYVREQYCCDFYSLIFSRNTALVIQRI